MGSFQYEEAVRLCERALRLAPQSVQVLETAGPLLLEVGETARGEEISTDTHTHHLCEMVE